MNVFRSPKRRVNPAELSSETCPLNFLIQLGEVEAALADRNHPKASWIREASVQAARAVLTNARPPKVDLPNGPLKVSIPEGYAYYGLDPATYVVSADRFYAEHCPAEAVCIGIRSIGTSLSALVAAALEHRGARVTSYTVRPEGDPFERVLNATPELLTNWLSQPQAWFIIVDEGPGLSGSTFCSVAEKLSEIGIPDNRIVFFPSWVPHADDLNSPRSQAIWKRHAKYASDPIVDPAWQPFVPSTPAGNPQHAARKYRHGGDLMKFEGLGPYGQARFERAWQLAAAGFSPRVFGMEHGYMRSEFVTGTPLTAHHRDANLLETMARYLAFRSREFVTSEPTPLEELSSLPVDFEPAQPVVTDGRMLPHEWLKTEQGYCKVDAVDHGDNHFYPGPTDIAWDLAGAIAEFQLDPHESAHLIDRYIIHSGDRHVNERLPFFRSAYRKFRQSYRSMYDC